MSEIRAIEAMDARLVAIERQCRLQRVALIVIPVALLAIGAAADSETWKGKSVVTEKLAVVDGEGRERILLAFTDKAEPYLSLVDPEQKLGITLHLKDNEDPVGKFRGKRGSAHIGLNEENDRPMVELVDENGKSFWGKGGYALD
jgi:hypothetical protein